MKGTKEILDRLYRENYLPKGDMIWLLGNLDHEDRENLFDLARRTRHKYYGNRVFLRGLIEISNICTRDCIYCGIRASNSHVGRYRLSEAEILKSCRVGYELGYRTFVLQGGEDPWFTGSKIAKIVSGIKNLYPDTAITLSLGERDYEDYRLWRKVGVDRYLLRHETASRKLYDNLHPGGDFYNRRKCLHDLKDLGYQIGAGFMVGLPGQTMEDMVEDLYFLKELGPHMVGIGPFIPAAHTLLGNESPGKVEDVALMLALVRLLVPHVLLPATTAMGSLHPKGRELALLAGANVVMPNLSPMGVRDKYALYDNKASTGGESAYCLEDIKRVIESVDMKVDMGRGDNYMCFGSLRNKPF